MSDQEPPRDPNGYQCPAALPLCLCGVRGCPDYVAHHRSMRATGRRRWWRKG